MLSQSKSPPSGTPLTNCDKLTLKNNCLDKNQSVSEQSQRNFLQGAILSLLDILSQALNRNPRFSFVLKRQDTEVFVNLEL